MAFNSSALIDSTNPLPVAFTAPGGSVSVYQATTIAVGGTAQNLFAGTAPANGFEIINTSTTEILYFRENAAAIIADPSSPAIQPGASYITPSGYKPTGPISVIAATAGHGLVARAY